MFADRAGMEAWLERYRARLGAEPSDEAERGERMRRANPKYLLRNWVAQEAIGLFLRENRSEDRDADMDALIDDVVRDNHELYKRLA